VSPPFEADSPRDRPAGLRGPLHRTTDRSQVEGVPRYGQKQQPDLRTL